MQYELVCWLEIHARIRTDSKLFCSCSNDVFEKDVNSCICPVCTGFPGQLPVLNEKAVELIIRAGKALNCQIPLHSKFDRKSYFYPDLPSWYQISQYDEPICGKWEAVCIIAWQKRKFGITRIHLENDAGKLTHTSNWSEVDLNRSWCPLMEIVTDPVFRDSEEVRLFLIELQKILRTCWVSDADMEKGQLRADVNVSLREKWKPYGVRAEIKNMNSFSSIDKAIKYEYQRQSKILDEWWRIAQETRGWNDKKWITESQRSKEEATDYRYFPEPDIPPVQLSQEFIDAINVPELPTDKYERIISQYNIKSDDAFIFAWNPELCDFFEATADKSKDPAKSANWILSELMALPPNNQITPSHIASLIILINSWDISGKIAKEIFPEMYSTWVLPDVIVESKWLKQISDTKALEEICRKVLTENPSIVATIKAWKDNALWSLIWKIMKETKWQANPQIINTLLKSLI